MRKIINSTYISLDGVIEQPHLWPSTGPDDEAAGAIQTELLLSCDAALMGRRTYEGFAPVWPTRSGTPSATTSTPCANTSSPQRCAIPSGRTPR